MDTPNSSDYIETKKRKQLPILCSPPESSAYIANKQYLTLQTTAVADDEGSLKPSERFQISLPKKDLATVFYGHNKPLRMFSIYRK